MRLALILAFVSSVFLTTERAEARPRTDQKTQTSKRAKKKVVKAPARTAKASRKAKVTAKVDEEETAVRDEDALAPKAEARPAPRRSGATVSQAVDDEVPRNEPKKR